MEAEVRTDTFFNVFTLTLDGSNRSLRYKLWYLGWGGVLGHYDPNKDPRGVIHEDNRHVVEKYGLSRENLLLNVQICSSLFQQKLLKPSDAATPGSPSTLSLLLQLPTEQKAQINH